MTGPKLNEGVLLVADDQVTTKAQARYVKGSASKVRVVLDLIRGLDVRRADEVLQFTERGAAVDVRKVLASAVANAVHNNEQDAEELFVLACFADEGPTLKRFRPRARGSASRIRKRTSHITVIVARMSDERLEVVQARQGASARRGGGGGTSARSRQDRVARSRARAEGLRGGASGSVDTASGADLPDGAVAAPEDGSVPEGYEIKGNVDSMKFHVPDGRYYDITNAELYFDTVEHAEAAGYEAPQSDSDLEASGDASVRVGDSPQADAADTGENQPADAIDESTGASDSETEAAEGSASDEAEAARDQSEAEIESAAESDEGEDQ